MLRVHILVTHLIINKFNAQLPMFRAFCTSASFASLEEILTNKVPIREIIIPTPAIAIGNWASIIMVAVACYGLVTWMLPATMQMDFFGEGLQDISSIRVFYACLVGLVVGAGISAFTEYYTGLGSKPILKIVQQSSTGAGTNIIAGLATGMISTFSSVLLFAAAIWASYALAGFSGVRRNFN